MRYKRLLLAVVLLAAVARPAPAGIFFGRHSRAKPAQRVPQLLATVRGDPKESNRASAARELREYDLSGFPDAVPVLADVLRNDPKPGVRAEAVQTLSKIRPASQEAGAALEGAVRDSSLRVRLQARSALLGYHVGSSRSAAKPNEAAAVPPAINTTAPAQPSRAAQPWHLLTPPPAPATKPSPLPAETAPPPLATPPEAPPKTPATAAPAEPPSQPMPSPQTPPPPPAEQGPELPPG